jgi:O-antigen/teichoic acid export membrane protein
MKENMNRLALKAGTWYVISNFFLKGIAILTTPIFTRLLSPEAFGITHTYTSWVGILTIIGTLDIYSCVQIARHDFKDEEIDSFISSILTVSTISLLFLYVIIKILGDIAVSFIALPTLLIDIMFLEVLFTNAFTIMQTKHKAYFRYKEFVAFSAAIAILSPIFAVLLISLQESDLYYGKIIGYAIPKLIISLFIYIYIIKKGKRLFNTHYWKYALVISIPLIPHHLAGNILSHFDKIMINKFAGASDTGLYSLAYSYSLILSVAWASFNQAWVPWFYSKMKELNYKDIKEYVKPYLGAFTIIYIGMLFVGPEALKIFGPEEYWRGIWVIPPVLLGIFFQFIYSLYVNVEFYLKKTQYIAVGTVIAAVLNIILNYLFIPKYGYIAAAYTTLVGYIVLFTLHYNISSKWIKKDLYGKKFIFGWISLIVLLTFFTVILYNYQYIRYTILVSITLIVFAKYRLHLIRFIKGIRRSKYDNH